MNADTHRRKGVRYHLRILDERGLTKRQGYDGRTITERGTKELEMHWSGQDGFIITRIEKLIYDTTFDLKTGQGNVIINTSIIDKKDIDETLDIMQHVIKEGYCFSPFIKIMEKGVPILISISLKAKLELPPCAA